MSQRVGIAPIRRLNGRGESRSDQDLVAVESPLSVSIRQSHGSASRSLGVLMRTPGDDRDLVLGLLYAEGIIRTPSDVVSVQARPTTAPGEPVSSSVEPSEAEEEIEIVLADRIDIGAVSLDRAGLATSACGFCGRLAIGAIDVLAGQALAVDRPQISAATILSLPPSLREGQAVFAETGGLHAAGLFDASGRLLAIREDVGRHNALDKLVGTALAAGWLPARESIVAVSGRVAYELVQKTVMAGAPMLASVGAPSSLAIQAARAVNLSLVGFVRDDRFNVYSGAARIK
jgi:FdhD protein